MHTPSEDMQARAGLLASEFSLLGLGAGLIVAAAAATAVQGRATLAVGREAALVGAGLCVLGTATMVVGHQLDVGGCRRRAQKMAAGTGRTATLGALTAMGALTAAMLPWPAQGAPMTSATALALWTTAVLFAVPALAGLMMRALSTPVRAAPAPVGQLLQAASHTLMASTAVLLVLSAAAERLGQAGRFGLASAVGTLAIHALVWAAWVLRSSRQTLRRARDAQIAVPMVERGHWLASLTTVLGLIIPGLVVMTSVVSGRETGLLLACAVMAASNHVMRYAMVLIAWSRLAPG